MGGAGGQTRIIQDCEGYAYLKGSGNRVRIPKLDGNLSLIIGLLWGDGWLTSREAAKEKSQWRIGLVEDDIELVTEYTNIFEKVFHVRPKIHDRKTKVEAYLNNRIIYDILNINYGFPDGAKIGRLRVPKAIYKNDLLAPRFLSGIFSTDGKFIITRGYPRIGLDSATKNFIVDVEQMLIRAGFAPRKTVWNRKVGNKLYGLWLNGRKQTKMFYEKINFVGEKTKKLKDYIGYNSPVV